MLSEIAQGANMQTHGDSLAGKQFADSREGLVLNDAQGYDLEEIVIYGSGEAREPFFSPFELFSFGLGAGATGSASRVLGNQAGSIGRRVGAIDDALRGLRPGRSANTRVVDSPEDLQKLFGQLTSGSKSVQGATRYPGRLMEVPDGTRVGLRATSKSGGPTIDIHRSNSRTIKIHVEGR